MISIIIPIYNAEKYLNDCLESIQQQTYSDLEVLMVDDGSKDGSAIICKDYANTDSRFHYISQQNAGVSVARNTGLSHSKGEWISFVDSDDMIDPRFFEEMIKHTKHVDAVWCGFSTKADGLGRHGKLVAYCKEKLIKNIIHEKGKQPQLWSLLYRRSIITENKLLFTPGCVRNEDYEFFMKYLSYCQNTIIWNGYVGYFYRQNPLSVMHQKRSGKSVLMSIEASSRVGEELEDIGIIPDKTWLTSFAVITQLFIMAREKNKEVYDEIHTMYPVPALIRNSLLHGGSRVKCAALLYYILRKRCFFITLSWINGR